MIGLEYKECRKHLEGQIALKEAELDSLLVKIADGGATQRDYTRRRCLEVSIESMRQRLSPKQDGGYDVGISIMR